MLPPPPPTSPAPDVFVGVLALPPIHELNAATTAAASSRGTRVHTVLPNPAPPVLFPVDDDDDDGGDILSISMGIVVPVNPRNWESAAER